MKRRSLMLLCVGAMLGSTLGALNVQAEEEVVLTIEMSQDMKSNNGYVVNDELYAAFEEKYPNIKIEEILVPDAQFKNVVSTKISAGEPSDIVIANRLNGQTDYNAKDNMLDLSDMEFVNNMLDPSIVTDDDGVIRCYQHAYPTGGSCVVYNKSLFEELSLEVPETFDEFVEVCQTLQDNGVQPLYGPYKEIWTFQIITSGAFGQLEAQKIPGTAEALNSGEKKWSEITEFVEVLERTKTLVDNGYFGDNCLSDDWASIPSKLSSGECGMVVAFDTTLDDLQDSEYEFAYFPLPIVDGIDLTISQPQPGECLFIPKDAKNIDAAKKYIDFVSTPEAGAISQQVKAYIPTVKDVETAEMTEADKYFSETYIQTGKVIKEFNTYITVDMNELWALYQEMLAGQLSPQEVLEEWDSTFASLMKQAGNEGF